MLKISLSRDVTKLTKLVHYALMIISSKSLLLLIVQNTETDKMKYLKQANILHWPPTHYYQQDLSRSLIKISWSRTRAALEIVNNLSNITKFPFLLTRR